MMQAAYKVAVFGQTLAQIRLSGLLEFGFVTPGGLLGATLDCHPLLSCWQAH